jgi:uncharacterized protein YdaL
MFLKSLISFIGSIIAKMIDNLLKFLYLSLPLWFHMFVLQMRDRVDTLPAINGYFDANSTWTIVYDGVVMVNTNPNAVKDKIRSIKVWFIQRKALWILLSVLLVVSMLGIIIYKVL